MDIIKVTITPDEFLGTNTMCLGEYCPKQKNSMGATDEVEAIEATIAACNRVAGCILFDEGGQNA